MKTQVKLITSKEKRKELFEKIKIPDGVEVEIDNGRVVVKGKNGINERKFSLAGLTLEKKENEIIIGTEKATKKEKMKIYTIAAHIKNMIRGVQEKFEYELKICFSHFPISVEVKENEVSIKNFLGEKVPRKTKLPNNVDVKVEKDIIKISSTNIEAVGQAAANLERVTKISKRDRRVFQDGIFIISKCGKEI